MVYNDFKQDKEWQQLHSLAEETDCIATHDYLSSKIAEREREIMRGSENESADCM